MGRSACHLVTYATQRGNVRRGLKTLVDAVYNLFTVVEINSDGIIPNNIRMVILVGLEEQVRAGICLVFFLRLPPLSFTEPHSALRAKVILQHYGTYNNSRRPEGIHAEQDSWLQPYVDKTKKTRCFQKPNYKYQISLRPVNQVGTELTTRKVEEEPSRVADTPDRMHHSPPPPPNWLSRCTFRLLLSRRGSNGTGQGGHRGRSSLSSYQTAAF